MGRTARARLKRFGPAPPVGGPLEERDEENAVFPSTGMADKATEVSEAIKKAEAELAAAAEAGSVWRLVDSATGSSAQNIDKLLQVAKEKQAAGELDEALRLANRVADAAMLGQQQARGQADAGPYYGPN